MRGHLSIIDAARLKEARKRGTPSKGWQAGKRKIARKATLIFL